MDRKSERIEGLDLAGSPRTPRETSSRQAWLLWGLGAVFVLILAVFFYPRSTVIADETCYLSAARYLLNGKAFDRFSEAWFYKNVGFYQRTFFSASPTFSALLIPFVAMGWRSAFVLGVLSHILGFGGLIYVFRRRGLPIGWAVLYLLHPTAVLYSHTVMADVPSSALVVLILCILHRDRPNHFAAGLVMGLLLLVKLSNFPLIAAFGLLFFLSDVVRKRSSPDSRKLRLRWVHLGLGMLPGVILFLIVNVVLFNSPLGNGYVGRDSGYFRWHYFLEHFPFYLVALMAMYPLMLISPVFLSGKYRWEMRLSCLAGIVFFAFYFYVDKGDVWYASLVLGLRFHLIFIPFYVIGYAQMLTRLARAVKRVVLVRLALVGATVILAGADVVMCALYAKETGRAWERQERLHEALSTGATVLAPLYASKYLNAAARPDLRIVRVITYRDFVYVADEVTPPAWLLVPRPNPESAVLRNQLIEMVRGVFELEASPRRVDGLEVWRLTRKRVTPEGATSRSGLSLPSVGRLTREGLPVRAVTAGDLREPDRRRCRLSHVGQYDRAFPGL